MSLLERLESMKKTAQKDKARASDTTTLTPRDALKKRVQEKLIQETDASILSQPDPEIKRTLLRARIEENISLIGSDINVTLTKKEHEEVIKELLDDILGLGVIQPLVENEDISEIMVNGPNQVYVEMKGKLTLTDVKFANEEAVRTCINKIIAPLGRRCDESMPYVDARLKDGSRVNAVIPPLALNGSTITIRKFKKDPLRVPDLIRFGAMTPTLADFLKATVMIARNVVVSGGTGSGKTTLLNALSSFISEGDRIATIEDAAEIQILQPHWVRLETKAANVEGKGAVTMRDLIRNTLRMRPDRVIVGECRGGETLDMLQAMNTGHDGSLTTLHSNTPTDCMRRIETGDSRADGRGDPCRRAAVAPGGRIPAHHLHLPVDGLRRPGGPARGHLPLRPDRRLGRGQDHRFAPALPARPDLLPALHQERHHDAPDDLRLHQGGVRGVAEGEHEDRTRAGAASPGDSFQAGHPDRLLQGEVGTLRNDPTPRRHRSLHLPWRRRDPCEEGQDQG
jgi:pilus assembly protein CpaF